MNSVKIIATIGPGSNKPEILLRLKDRGVSFFRINLSHTNKQDIEKRINDLKPYGVPIILDTEGSQIRSGNSHNQEVDFKEGDLVKLHNKEIKCNSRNFCLNPADSVKYLREGDFISIDFNSVLLKVYSTEKLKSKGFIECRVLIGGRVGGRKAVYIDSPTFSMPAFSEKDLFAVKLAKKYGIGHFTLSFMKASEDVNYFRSLCPRAKLYSKIESRKGLMNFIEIAKVSDGILIDRGDLSHDVPIERIPLIQKHVIDECRKMNKEIFIATNTLEQMSFSLKPNRAEVNDIVNTILDGATGIALTKETAVGKFPVETVNMLSTIIKQIDFIGWKRGLSALSLISNSDYVKSPAAPHLLIKPHGGILINKILTNGEKNNLKNKILIDEDTLMDLEQIAIGAYSPIDGFMMKKDFESVRDRMRLANGIVWPLPIILQINEREAKKIKEGESAELILKEDGIAYGSINVEEIYKVDKKEYVLKLFGTDDMNHPGVRDFMNRGDYFVGGKIILLRRRNSPHKMYELTPRQTRKIFAERGWSKIVGFHTRNVPHKSHEFIQMKAYEKSLADGIFIHPIIGKKKSGDFSAEVIIESYEKAIEKSYPENRVVLSAFASYSRYAGPREALFTAIVRKNYGCSHFVVGRDHTGVGNYYNPKAAHQIFDKFKEEEIGIIPVKFDNVFYSTLKKEHIHESADDEHKEKDKKHISGTELREMLRKGKTPPDWFMRKEISELIIKKIKKGLKVFVE